MNSAVLARNLRLLRDRDEALEALGGLKPLAIKGAVLAASLYRPDERPMEDLDLLVPAGRRDEAAARLERLGYAAEPGNPTNLRRGGTALDLEDTIWYLDPAAYRALWDRAIIVDGAPTLSWEDHFVFVVAHSAAHHGWWDQQHAGDLRRLLARPLDWDACARRLAQAGLQPAFEASARLLGLTPPPALRRPLDLRGKLEARGYELLLRRGQLPAIGHYLRFWSAADKAAHLRRVLFPEAGFLKRRYGPGAGASGWARPIFLAGSVVRSAAQAAWVLASGGRPPALGAKLQKGLGVGEVEGRLVDRPLDAHQRGRA